MTESVAHPAISPQRHPRTWIFAVAVIVCVTMARMVYVSLYGAAVPFWDQWDELDQLIRPWVQGNWHVGELLSAHNEHRIAFTRLISLALFAANGGIWDNLVEAYANTLIYACVLALLYTFLCRGDTRPGIRWMMFVAVVAIGSLPFDWENTLVGFQNQFYLMEMFAIAMVGVAAYRQPNRATFWLLLLMGAASLFTMGAGPLAAAAVCVTIVLRSWSDTVRPAFLLSLLSVMLLAILIGLAIIPHRPGSDINAAQGLQEHVRAGVIALMWPMQSFTPKHALFALLVWSPTLLWLLRFLRLRRAESRELFAIGIAAWVVLQAIAIAHARGHGMGSLPSRYMEILAIGLLANLWLALHMVRQPSTSGLFKIAGVTAVCLGISWVAMTFVKRTRDDYLEMQERHAFSELQTHQIRAYLTGGNFAVLQKQGLIIPYPDAKKLQGFLETPSIRMALAPSIKTSIGPAIEANARVKDSSQVLVAPHGGWLSGAAVALQEATRDLVGRFGLAVPDMLYEELSSASTFSSTTAQPYKGECALDAINFARPQLSTITEPNGPLQVTGWVVDSRNMAPTNLMLMLVGPKTYQLGGRANIRRPDVANIFHSHTALRSGFSVTGSLDHAASGAYEIKLVMKDNQGSEGICDAHHGIVVEP